MNKKTVSTVAITVAICFVLFVVSLVGFIHHRKWIRTATALAEQTLSVENGKLKVDPNAGAYVPPETSATTGGGISIPGWGYISIPENETEVAVDFPNPEANDGKYYLSFELRLKDTGEVLYTSGLVPPGQTIQSITLSRPLTEGTYSAVVHVQPYTMDDSQTPTNNADMETELVVYKK